MFKLLASAIILLFLQTGITSAHEENSKWYLVAIMKGLNANGQEDVFVFNKVEFDSFQSCQNYPKEKTWDVVFTLSFVYGAKRDFRELSCGEEKYVKHLLPKDEILWKVLESPIKGNAILAVKLSGENKSANLEFLGMTFHTSSLCKLYFEQEKYYVTEALLEVIDKKFKNYNIESFGCVSEKEDTNKILL